MNYFIKVLLFVVIILFLLFMLNLKDSTVDINIYSFDNEKMIKVLLDD